MIVHHQSALKKNKIALDVSLFIKSPKWCWFVFYCPITSDKCSEAWYTVSYEVIRHRQNGQVYYWITDFIWGVSLMHGNLQQVSRIWSARWEDCCWQWLTFRQPALQPRIFPICIGTIASTLVTRGFAPRSSSPRQSSCGNLTNLTYPEILLSSTLHLPPSMCY